VRSRPSRDAPDRRDLDDRGPAEAQLAGAFLPSHDVQAGTAAEECKLSPIGCATCSTSEGGERRRSSGAAASRRDATERGACAHSAHALGVADLGGPRVIRVGAERRLRAGTGVDIQALPGDPGGEIGEQEQHRPGDLDRVDTSAERAT